MLSFLLSFFQHFFFKKASRVFIIFIYKRFRNLRFILIFQLSIKKKFVFIFLILNYLRVF